VPVNSLALANFQIMFYLPLYFQSVKGTTAIMSGVYNLPTVAFFSLGVSGPSVAVERRATLTPVSCSPWSPAVSWERRA
jgi:hypothetical protein